MSKSDIIFVTLFFLIKKYNRVDLALKQLLKRLFLSTPNFIILLPRKINIESFIDILVEVMGGITINFNSYCF